jgi:rod shape determining protein RodA
MTPPAVSSPIRDVDDVPVVAPARAVGLTLPFDPILLLAVIGICAASLVTLGGATADDIPGDPHYYVNRQAIYFVVGLVLAVILARIDYSRLRATKYVVYGLLIASILAVQALGTVARGSRRAIDVGFFSFRSWRCRRSWSIDRAR